MSQPPCPDHLHQPTRRAAMALLGTAAGCLVSWPAAASTSDAPPFDLPRWDISSNTPHRSERLALTALRGRWTYLDFWASWCGPCRQSFPWMNDLADRLATQRLQVVAIGLDTKAEPMARFIAQHRPRFTVLWDARQSTPPLYQVQAMPSSYLIDPQGRQVWAHRGFSPSDAPAIEAGIRARIGLS
ncbi:MAG: redoxin domain-containing protein [Burkholderiaceae bacterium]